MSHVEESFQKNLLSIAAKVYLRCYTTGVSPTHSVPSPSYTPSTDKISRRCLKKFWGIPSNAILKIQIKSVLPNESDTLLKYTL